MCLSKQVATAIVDAVRRDATCQMNINSGLRRLPASWGISGTLRNIGYYVSHQDPTDPAVAKCACSGIGDATRRAIENTLKGNPGIPEVQAVERLDRLGLVDHSATKITMQDGSSFVFDWHATLNARNPLIFTESDWLRDSRTGQTFAKLAFFPPALLVDPPGAQQYVMFSDMPCHPPVPTGVPTPTPSPR
jgi:hypothetical protein